MSEPPCKPSLLGAIAAAVALDAIEPRIAGAYWIVPPRETHGE